MKEKKISVQNIAEILVDELAKVENHATEIAKIQADFNADVGRFVGCCNQHLKLVDQVTRKPLKVDTSNIALGVENVMKTRIALPRIWVFLLVIQPIVIAIITALIVGAYITDIELVAWNKGKEYALSQSK